MKRKITEHDFLQYISEYDIVFLSETWIPKTNSINLDINGYTSTHIPGNKSQRARRGRYSGGISLYYKTDLKTHSTVLEKEQSGIIWIQLFSHLMRTFICAIYIYHQLLRAY